MSNPKSPSKFPRVWLFHSERRVYPKAEKGRLLSSGGPIYRERWQEGKITAETRVSWLTEHGRRIPKKGGCGIAFSLQEVEDDVWRNDHRYYIAQAIQSLRDVATLRKVAEFIGYTPKAQ